MGDVDALFYELPPRGSSGNSDQSRFRLVDFRNATWAPNDRWVLIARRTGGTGELKWLPAQITMPPSSTYDTTTGIGSWMQSVRMFCVVQSER